MLDDTVVVFVAEELPDSVRLINALTDGEEESLIDMWAEPEAETVNESELEIDEDPVTLYDS